jgi:hypothetical protein
MVVVRFDLGAMQRTWNQAQRVSFFNNVRPALPQFRVKRPNPLAFLNTKAPKIHKRPRTVCEWRQHDRSHDAVP